MDNDLMDNDPFFELERNARPVLDGFYRMWGGQVDRSVACQSYDLVWTIGGVPYRIEEKMRRVDALRYDDCLVELRQDVIRPKEGWFYYCDADVLSYGFFDEEQAALRRLYLVKMKNLRAAFKAIVEQEEGRFVRRLRFSVKGWGVTLNASLKWDEIPDVKVYDGPSFFNHNHQP